VCSLLGIILIYHVQNFVFLDVINNHEIVQGDSKRWTQFLKSIFQN
jgi:hypothetical protein